MFGVPVLLWIVLPDPASSRTCFTRNAGKPSGTMTRVDKELYPFLVVVILTVAALVAFWSFLDMVVLGASLAVVLLPFHRRLAGHVRPVISAVIITVSLFCLIIVAAYIIITILRANAGILDGIFATIASWLGNPATQPGAFGVPISRETLSAWLAEGESLFVNYWAIVAANLTLILFKGLVFFITIFLLLLKGEALVERMHRHVPRPLRRYWEELAPVTVDTLYVIYIVQIAIAVLTFFIAIPVFWLLGYGNILFYSFLAAFCELIPILGSSVAFIVIGAYALALGDLTGVLILFLLGYVVVSALPEIYIRPVLVGRRVKIHPVIMFIGLIGGILTMGLAGFVLGPLIIVLLMRSYRIWTGDHKGRKEGPGPDGGTPGNNTGS